MSAGRHTALTPEVIAEAIVGYAADRKALDIVQLDLRGMIGYTDYFVICTGRTDRQRCERGRFLRKIQLAQICISAGKEAIAQTLLDDIGAATEDSDDGPLAIPQPDLAPYAEAELPCCPDAHHQLPSACSKHVTGDDPEVGA